MHARKMNTALLLIALLFTATAQSADSEDDKVFYYLGVTVGASMQVLELSASEAEQVVAGLGDALAGTVEQLDDQVYSRKVQQLTQERLASAARREQEAGQAYLALKAAEAGAVRTASGLVYRETLAGSGAQPVATSIVRAHYKGTLRDGSVFDSSFGRGEPLQIGLNQVIPCWTEGIVKMKEGGKAVLTCPPQIAYGPQGQGKIPPNATLTFEVELVEVVQ